MEKRKRVCIVSFSIQTKAFSSLSERNTFFRELYGYRQVVKRGKKRYVYLRKGILDEVPHLKIDNSVFLIPEDSLNKILNYFKKWEKKVRYRLIRVLLEEKKLLKELEKIREAVEYG